MMAAKKKASRALLLILLSCLLLWAWQFPLSRSEPVYQGKTLSAWAEQYSTNLYSPYPQKQVQEEAKAAIQMIGTNGIPFLLNMLRATPSPTKSRLRRLLPPKWHSTLHLWDRSGQTRRAGSHGLAVLGTNAAPALAQFIELATHHPMEESPNPYSDGRYVAMSSFRGLGLAAEPAIPFFIQCLTNERPGTRDEAIGLLGQFGTNAKSSVPLLLPLLNDPSQNVRESVTNWLPRIDAQAAKNYIIHR